MTVLPQQPSSIQAAPNLVQGPGRALPGYVVTDIGAEELRVFQGDTARRGLFRDISEPALIWNGGLIIALAAGVADSGARSFFSSPLHWVFALATLAGSWMAHARLWSFYGREEWRAGTGYLERRWGWSFSPVRNWRRYTAGEFELWACAGVPSDSRVLLFRPRGGLRTRLIAKAGPGTAPQGASALRSLGQLLADRTGWPLTERG